jgi:HPt (histidine-containing phosphotransfer) domain-containing protein
MEGLRNRCMGNIHLVQRVLRAFQERIPAEMETIEQAFRLRDVEQIARIAHRVKGSSASMSAGGLAQAAAEMEDAGRAGRVEEIPARIEHLRDEWEKYLDCAVTLLSSADTA